MAKGQTKITIISMGAEKVLEKVQDSFFIKMPGIRGRD